MNAESEKPDDTMSPGAEQPAKNAPNNMLNVEVDNSAGVEADPIPDSPLDPLATAQAEAAEHKDKMLRTLAELENYRRRAEKERQDVSKYAITAFARDCLTVVDNLRRGLESVTAEERQVNPALETLAAGMELTEREMLTTLERHGIEKIVPLGAPFDHNLHQSMLETEDATKPVGSMVQGMQAG